MKDTPPRNLLAHEAVEQRRSWFRRYASLLASLERVKPIRLSSFVSEWPGTSIDRRPLHFRVGLYIRPVDRMARKVFAPQFKDPYTAVQGYRELREPYVRPSRELDQSHDQVVRDKDGRAEA